MIREEDLLEAIAECQGERNPNANTCRNLAAFYTIMDHLNPKPEAGYSGYSYERGNSFTSDSEFGRTIRGKSLDSIMPLMDELMITLQVIQPRLYDAVITKLKETY